MPERHRHGRTRPQKGTNHRNENALARQFDALVHWDESHALEPLDKGLRWHEREAGEVPETSPSGI
jgi:hypothetical protein